MKRKFNPTLATTFCICYGLVLLLGMPLIIRYKPLHPSPREILEYESIVLAYVSSLVLSFVAAAGFAMVVMIDARDRLTRLRVENLQTLLDIAPGLQSMPKHLGNKDQESE